jgi:hypothetical protein
MKQSPHLCKDGLIIDSGPSKQSFFKNRLSAIGRVEPMRAQSSLPKS